MVIAKFIDHTLLKPDAVQSEIEKLCREAREYEFASVCVNPYWVKLCAAMLKGSSVKVCTVIGFPLGANSYETKVFETGLAIEDGASEIDMVINIGAIKSSDYEVVKREIESVAGCARSLNAILKVIIETSLLTDDEKARACKISKEAGADFVKTSTGFAGGGATVADIELMRRTVGSEMGVKASGGIRDFQTAQQMINAGATRIGASAGVNIVKESQGQYSDEKSNGY